VRKWISKRSQVKRARNDSPLWFLLQRDWFERVVILGEYISSLALTHFFPVPRTIRPDAGRSDNRGDGRGEKVARNFLGFNHSKIVMRGAKRKETSVPIAAESSPSGPVGPIALYSTSSQFKQVCPSLSLPLGPWLTLVHLPKVIGDIPNRD
jgi:hypothetical protein